MCTCIEGGGWYVRPFPSGDKNVSTKTWGRKSGSKRKSVIRYERLKEETVKKEYESKVC